MLHRKKKIIRVSILGVTVNLLLAVLKAIIGLLSGSIAIVLDAVNNLSDVLSSVVTIVGTKLAGKQPDKKHPYGHGRIEYFSTLIISMIILYAGITSLRESVMKMINPVVPEYTFVGLFIILVAVITKIILGWYVKRVGNAVNSNALVASGKDALLDAVISASTLVAAGVFLMWGISLEASLGAIISIVILKSGFQMLRSTTSEILGERVDSGITGKVKEIVTEFKDVRGAYDLILHNYGPDCLMGSVHIEVPDTYSIQKLDVLERKIVKMVYEKTGVILEAVGIYSVNTKDKKAFAIQQDIKKIVLKYEHILQLHGFYFNEIEKSIHFDIVMSFEATNRMELYRQICDEVQEKYKDYELHIVLDHDISD